MAAVLVNRLDWGRTDDEEGHRTYEIDWLVVSDYEDGPHNAMLAAGLPAVGSYWSFGADVDAWAFCWPNWRAKVWEHEHEPGRYWKVSQTFTTKPLKRCQDVSVDNPLSEPDRVSGSFVKYVEEARYDRNGDVVKTSSHEPFHGSLVERDNNRPSVRIGKNVSSSPVTSIAPMIDTVNDTNLWGLPARTIKLSNATWTRQQYGVCYVYYSVDFEFDIDYRTYDVKLLDQGTKVLVKGGDPNNPRDFVQYKDRNNENGKVILDGAGQAWDGSGSPGEHTLEKYSESNFLLLDIPTSL